MYRSFFKLREDPFDNCPDPRFFYNSPAHEEALASLQHVATHRKGAVLITGAPGVGKTLVGRLAVRGLGSEVRTVWLRDPLLSTKELLVEICRGFRIEVDSDAAQVDLMSLLERFLSSQFGNDTVVCIVVDDVQDFSPEAFRLLRTLNNMEVDDAKLVQLILLGHPSAQAQAVSHLCEGFQERLYRILELPPLDLEQTRAYVCHRLRLAGSQNEVSFTSQAVARIHRVSGGIPRAINKIAEFALLAAYAQSVHIIGTEILNRVIEENQVDTAGLLEAPAEGDRPAETPPQPAGHTGLPAAAPTPPRELPQEVQHIRLLTRGMRVRKERLQEAVTLAQATLEHLHDASATSHQSLTRLENTFEQTRLMTEAARAAEIDLHAERDRLESQVKERVTGVASQVDDLLHKLDSRQDDFDRLQERAQRAAADARDQIGVLEQADQHSVGLASSIEQLHGRARGAADIYRSLQARLDATQDRVEHTTANAAEHLVRLDQHETELSKRLDSAKNAIAALAKVAATEQRLDELLKTARGSHASLDDTHRRVLQTLQESEDHFGELAEALAQGRRYLAEAQSAAADAREERQAAESARQETQDLLQALEQRNNQLNQSMSQVSERIQAVRQANLQAEDLLASSHAAVDELGKTCAQSAHATHDAAEEAEERLAKVQEQLAKTSRKAEVCLAGVKAQLAEAEHQTVSDAERHLAERHRQLLAATNDAATDAEARLGGAREQFTRAASNAEARLVEVKSQLAEAADQTVTEANHRLTARQRQLLDTGNGAAAEAEARMAAAGQQFAAAAESAEERLQTVRSQVAEATDQAAQDGASRLAAKHEQLLESTTKATNEAEARLAAAGEQFDASASTAEARLEEVTSQLAEATDQTAAEAEARLTDARGQFEAAAAQAQTQLDETTQQLADLTHQTLSRVEQRLAEAKRDTAESVRETVHQANTRLDDASRQYNDMLAQTEDRLDALQGANLAAEQNAETVRRLLRQLDDGHERNLVLHRDAQRAHAELFEQTGRANDALARMDETLPKLEEARQRAADLLLRADRKTDELQETYRQGDTFLKKGTLLISEFRSWKQELLRDRAQAAKVLKRARQHLGLVMEAEARARAVVQTADQRTEKFDATLLRADKMLADTGQRLTRMVEAHAKMEGLLARGVRRLVENQAQADAIILALEKKQAVARGALDKLERSTSSAQRISKMQIRVGAGFRKKTKRLAASLYAQKETAEQALQALQQATAQAEQAVAQPHALLEEALQRVPQLQKLCKLLHEVYFKLNTHVPDMITPGDWEKMNDTAEGATRQLLIANTARIRQLVDVARRLFEKTAERMAHLQSENERASTLCRMLPRRVEQSTLFMSSSGPMRQQLSKAADRIHQAADAVKTSSQDGSASVTGDPPSVKDHLQAASPEARSSRVADLAKRAAGLAEIVQRAAAGEKPKAGPAISGRSPSEHPLAEKVLESQ